MLNVHGGPWARDTWGYDPEAQWLANRGYAVLQVNFRGSTGFGKKFLNAGNERVGLGKMQHDLIDAVKWAVGKGIADPKKVCIYGGSYGGYATLVGLDLHAGAVRLRRGHRRPVQHQDAVRVDPALLGADQEAVRPARRRRREGRGAQPEDLAAVPRRRRSRVPLLIAQGANDPRVNIREADQIVEAMRDKELPVTYVVYPDEGHGFARPENRLDFYGRVERVPREAPRRPRRAVGRRSRARRRT